MKRLFVIKNSQGKLLKEEHGVLYFDNKMKAKETRDLYNKVGVNQYFISKGPDHIGNHGHKIKLQSYKKH